MVLGTGYLSGALQLIAFIKKQDFMGYKALLLPGWKDWLLSFNFWDANRIIPGTLNFYPYFSFLQGDMHAPTMSFPFRLTFLFLILVFIRKEFSRKSSLLEMIACVLAMALNLGFLLFVHSWDYPIYVMALGLTAILLKRNKLSWFLSGNIIFLSILLFSPFVLQDVGKGLQGIGRVTERTSLSSIVEMMALSFFIILSALFIMARKQKLQSHWVVFLSSSTIIAIPVLKFPLLLILVPVIALSVYFSLKKASNDEEKIVAFFALTGATIVLLLDVFYFRDSMRGVMARFNTILKLYYDVWLFLGLAAGVAFVYVLKQLKIIPRYVWLFFAVLLILSSIVHPVATTTAWTSGRHQVFGIGRGTWNGTAYLWSLHPADYEAILWLDRNVHGSPVVLEMPGVTYTYSSRISSLTGLPTVIGWGTHEIMWRSDWSGVGERTGDTDAIYSTLDAQQAIGLLGKYNVKYVFVGELEKGKYSSVGLAKFNSRQDLFHKIYDKGGVQIYEVLYGK
jgi:YYY domain-containing protein